MPERIQQRRTKGWRKPANTVGVARPSRYGNPYTVKVVACEETAAGGFCWAVGMRGRPMFQIGHFATSREARAVAVKHFEHDLRTGRLGYGVSEVRANLRGSNLMCFCPLDHPCHVDVLLEIANA